jgi:hypothetical protein
MSRTAGSMYADGTEFEGYNYYFALGYQPNKNMISSLQLQELLNGTIKELILLFKITLNIILI